MKTCTLKNSTLLLFLLTLFAVGLQAQTIYVKGDVVGGDGTSWATAYQYLDDAVAAANPGDQIWVATGTYYPGGASPARDTFFSLKNQVDIYGGFAGTETMLSERDPVANLTELSGDIDQNDTDGEFFAPERFTNANSVFVVDPSVQDAILDGFTISHGQTDTLSSSPDRRGGGMLIFGAPTIRNCIFEQNGARLAGGVYPRFSDATGTTFENCTFRNNRAFFGGASYVFDCADVLFDNCTFVNNGAETSAGGIYGSNANFEVTGCTFDQNSARFGGICRLNDGLYIFENSDITNNSSENIGGGAYFIDTDFEMEDCLVRGNNSDGSGAGVYAVRCNFVMNQMTVDSNDSGSFGGGLYAYACNFNLSNSIVSDNITGTQGNEGGGGMYIGAANGDTSLYIISNTTFASNSAPFAAGIAAYSDGSIGRIQDCPFISNNADFGGGGIACSFGSTTEILDCEFNNNSVGYGGGIFGGGNVAGSQVRVKGCDFENNSATRTGGGAISVFTDGLYDVDSCYFSGNVSTTGFGGAIDYRPDSFPLNAMVIQSCEFLNNNGFDQGGALNVGDGDVLVMNSLFNFNKVTPDPNSGAIQGRGAAFSNNASSGDSSVITLVHCTIVNGDGSFAGGISQWEGDSTAHAEVQLQNNIFMNFGPNYAVEEGTPTLVSYGGNLVNDSSMDAFLTGTNDAGSVTDFGFVDDYGEDDLHLLQNSPAKDQGVTMPFTVLTDIEGSPRDDMPDIGAYEFILVLSNRPEIGEANLIQLQPNPAIETTQISLEHPFTGDFELRVTNALGQTIYVDQGTKSGPELQYQLPLERWAKGIYEVSIEMDQALYTQRLIKQ